MAKRPLQYLAIFLTVFIDIIGFGIVIPVLPLYAQHYGATVYQIGWMVGVFSLMQFFFAPVWGKISDRIGRKPVLLIGALGTIVGYSLMGLAETVTLLFWARLINGIAGANIGTAQAYLADISPPEGRARAMGLLGAAFGLGFVFGPALGGWASTTFTYSTPMYIAAVLGGLNFLFVLIFLPESRQSGTQSERKQSFSALFQNVEVRAYVSTLVCYFLVISGFSMMTTVFALLLFHRFELDALHTGYLLAGIGIIGVLIQGGLIGRLVKKFGEVNLAFVGALSMSVGLAGLAYSANFTSLLFSSFAIGVGNSLLMPTLSSLASRSAAPAWQGRALGVIQSSGSLARWTGPMITGTLLTYSITDVQHQYAYLPLITAAGLLVVAAGGVWLLRLTHAKADTFQNA